MPVDRIDAVVSLAKRRGFVYPSSEIYGGTRSAWDYGPLGVEMKRNVKNLWWRDNVHRRDKWDMSVPYEANRQQYVCRRSSNIHRRRNIVRNDPDHDKYEIDANIPLDGAIGTNMVTTAPVVERSRFADFQSMAYARDQRPHVVVLVEVPRGHVAGVYGLVVRGSCLAIEHGHAAKRHLNLGSLFALLADFNLEIGQSERRKEHLRLRDLETFGERVGPDHRQLDLDLAPALELRLKLADVGFERPSEDVDLEDTRGESILNRIVDLLSRHAARQRAD